MLVLFRRLSCVVEEDDSLASMLCSCTLALKTIGIRISQAAASWKIYSGISDTFRNMRISEYLKQLHLEKAHCLDSR